ncbi:MerR family transcriptional regulator [Microbacterium keratanolyticum]
MFTTGQIAHLSSLSEKAVRLYADRGLLRPVRDDSGFRRFDETQLDRSRRIALLRSMEFSLTEVADILDAADPTHAFDEVWRQRRRDAVRVSEAAEYVRLSLSGKPELPLPLREQRRDVDERSVLRVRGSAALADLSHEIPRLTGIAFDALTAADAPLVASPFVAYASRATESFPADIMVCVPFGGAIVPPMGVEIVRDPAHQEVFVSLTQEQVADQVLLVAVHDHLSALHGHQRVAPNREIYLPAFGSGESGTVMEIAVPVR